MNHTGTKTVAAILVFIVCIGIVSTTTKQKESEKELPRTERMVFENANDQSGAAEKILDCVVGISSRQGQSESVGSGFIVTENGYIATNYHVVGSINAPLKVTLSDGKVVSGKALWGEPVLDVAIVKISQEGLTPAVLGDAKALRPGEAAIAVGNPLGLQFQRTVTAGVISALNRTITVEQDGSNVFMEDLIQTDASINPGNSGGPLVNGSGEVVGINTIKVSTAEGIGFAVPINLLRPVIDSFEKNGAFKTPYLGIYGYDKNMAQYLNQDFGSRSGVMIAYTEKGSPAEKAGLSVGSIITHINRHPVNTMLEVREILYGMQSGECTFSVIQNGTLSEIKVAL